MHIDFWIEEYFEQLQLMEKQYGQEEDLYPWIYMLLQMVEGKKRELISNYQGISIRDVHNAKSVSDNTTNAIRQFLDSKEAYPDFVIFDRNNQDKNKSSCFGCVEIKALHKDYIEPNNNEAYEIGKIEKYIYEMKFKMGEGVYGCYGINKELYNMLKNKDFQVVSIDNNKIRVSLGKQEIEIEGSEKKYLGRPSEKTYVRKIPKWGSVKPFKIDTVSEMMSHIKSYEKVLYTNGLQFCFIVLLKDNTFMVTEIANLTGYYDEYKNQKDIGNDAILEWENLKRGLMSIDWYNDPIEIKISN